MGKSTSSSNFYGHFNSFKFNYQGEFEGVFEKVFF